MKGLIILGLIRLLGVVSPRPDSMLVIKITLTGLKKLNLYIEAEMC